MSESLLILFCSGPSRFLGYEAIVYQANPLRGDKISDSRVCQGLQRRLPPILQARRRLLQRRIRIYDQILHDPSCSRSSTCPLVQLLFRALARIRTIDPFSPQL
jgi:hypothetical protein